MTKLSESLERAEQAHAGALEAGADGPTTIFEQLRGMQNQFAAALPARISPEHFLRVAVTELRLKPDLQTCTPASLFGALMLSAQLGLVPGPLGHVYLVPYGNSRTRAREIQFQIGYKGYVVLAKRAGYAITGDTVREGDTFEIESGTAPHVLHRPKIRGAGEAYAWWAMAVPLDGGPAHVKHLEREAVEKYRKRSRASASAGGPWTTDYDAMALKTVVRRIMQLLPLDTEQAAAADWSADGSRALWQPATHELTLNAADDLDTLEGEPDDTEAGA